ncbi:MAG: hypothetical protein LBK99_23865 [Opitutaceae bacterium]|nr:hypothetical protein [Opitutaceae bacterium]
MHCCFGQCLHRPAQHGQHLLPRLVIQRAIEARMLGFYTGEQHCDGMVGIHDQAAE